MNSYTKLIIDNQEIDLYSVESLPLNITRRVNDLGGSIQGDYSRSSITVPATKNNISILGRARTFFSFRIEVDGVPSFFGTARVRQGKTYSQGSGAIEENYDINLISNNSSWYTLLANTLLSELTDLSVDFTQANILAGWNKDSYLNGWGFGLIKLKEWANFVASPLQYQPSYYESTPLINLKQLFIAAFNSIGYTIASDFFDTPMFEHAVMDAHFPEKMGEAFGKEYLNTKVSSTVPFTFSATPPANFPFDILNVVAPQNPTAFDNVTNYDYTVPLTGYYEVSIVARFGSTPVTVYDILVEFTQNGSTLSPNIGFGYTDFGPGGVPYPAGQTVRATTVVLANASDILTWRLTSVSSNVTIDFAECTIVGEAIPEPGFPVDFRFLLSNYKALDMIAGVTAIFNLSYETDDSLKTVYIEPKDAYISRWRFSPIETIRNEGFYKDSPSKDYSKLVDYNKVGSFKFPSVNESLNYKYASDSDPTIEYVEGINDFKIYEARFPIADGSDSGATTQEVPFFKKTIHVFDDLAKYPGTNRAPQFPLMYPQNYILDPTATTQNYDFGPRIFIHAGMRGPTFAESDGLIEVFEALGAPHEVPMTFMVNYNDETGLDPNLGFDSKEINGQESPGILQNYYLQECVRLDRGEIRENYVRFNSVDNNNLSFRVKGFIDSQVYVLQEIKAYNPVIDSPTNFQFFLDVTPTLEDVNNIQNSPLLGVVSLLST